MVKVFKSVLSCILILTMLFNMVVFVSAAERDELSASFEWTNDFEQGEWKKDGAAFSVSDFEPGSEVIRYFKIENAGELAFSYEMNLIASEMGVLASVIDVYCKKEIASNVTVANMTKIGTLAEVLNGLAIGGGSIVPEGESVSTAYTKETVVAVAFKMAENVANEFMDKGTGDFSIQLNLTSFDEANKFKVKFENTDKYLYRVGNANAVSLSSLFEAVDRAEIGNVSVAINSLDANTDVAGTYTANSTDWTLGTIKFSGTGPVEVTIDDDKYTNPVSLKLEVVDATNVTAYSGLKNQTSVLLNDITMSSGANYYLSNATLYGNGFTFDVTNGAYTGKGSISNNYLVCISNASIDNVKIVGSVYTKYGAQVDNEYNRPVVLSIGDSTITNSYIANCAAPVRVRDGNLEIINSTLKGGNFANLDIRNGNIILDNVTTINQVNGNDLAADGTVVVGLGIVVYYENVLDTATVEVRNGITQYNNLSETQVNTYITDATAKQLTSQMFKYSDIQYNDGSDTWVNTGIFSMTENVGDSNISNVDGYASMNVSYAGKNGFVRTKVPDATSVSENVPAYESSVQYAIAPAYSFEYPLEGKKNYIAVTEDSNRWCYYDNGTVRISFDDGESVSFDTSILTVTKQGQVLPYTVTMNGTDYTEKNITFNSAGSYQLVYTYSDDNNYAVDANGEIEKYTMTYNKVINIKANAVMPDAKNAGFDFGSNGSKSVTAGGNTYIMPNVSATSANKIGSKTIDGQTIYYPIVEIIMSDGKTSHSSAWNAYFPVLSGIITITDYANEGTGDAVTYGASTTTMPEGLSLVGDASALFKYQSSSLAGASPVVKNNILVYSSPSISAKREEYNTVVEYTYTDNKGATYHYFVGYHAPAQSYSSICVTGDTLVTLADGSLKRIDEVTYDDILLVWDFFEGKYAASPAGVIVKYDENEYPITDLYFDDSTKLRFVGRHGLYDADLSQYIFVDEYNIADFVGHSFVKITTEDGVVSNKYVKLVDYKVSREFTKCYSLQTVRYDNCVAEGILTITPHPVEGWYDYCKIGENMKYDAESMEENIAKYGLYTYADFEDYISEDVFYAFNCPYLKIIVGKGYCTFDDIIALIEKYGLGIVRSDEQNIASLNFDEEQSLTITLAGNSIAAANYDAMVSGEGVAAGESGYTINAAECDIVVTASGTATTGYAKITVGEDVYYTNQIAKGESFTLTVKNAVGKELSVESFWGNSANYDVAQDALIESGKVIEYTYTVEITATNATETENGYAVTENESVFKLTANGSATPGYAKISVNGDDYYTEAIAKGETFTFTVNNAKGKTVAIETFYGEPTAENLIASGSKIGYVAEVTAENATLNEDGKYVVDADEATITVTASGTSEGYAKITVGEEVYYTKQIVSGESFVMTLKNAKGKIFDVETIWAKSENDGVAQDALVESGKVIEYTYTVEITATNAMETENGYAVTDNESVFTIKAFGTATMGYAVVAVDGDVYYTQKIVPDEEVKVTLKNAKGKIVEITSFYGEFDYGTIPEEYILGNDDIIDCGTFSIKSVEGTKVVLSNTTKYASETVDIYVAVYDSQNRMVAVKSESNVSVAGKDEHTFDSKLTIPENGYAKVFVWSGNGAFKPFFSAR